MRLAAVMKTRPVLRLLSGALIALFCAREACSAAEPPLSVDIGGRKIIIPVFEGFARADGVNANWDKLSAPLVADTNRMVATLLQKDDVARLAQGLLARPRRVFQIQTYRNAETVEISDETFSQARNQIRAGIEESRATIEAEIKKRFASKSNALSGLAGVDVALSITNSTMLGYFGESPTSLGFTTAMKVGAKTSTISLGKKVVVAMMVTTVNGRIFYLAATSDYYSEADREWVEKAVVSWRDAVRGANPKVEKKTAAEIAATAPMPGTEGNGCRVEVKVGEPIISVSVSDKTLKKTTLWVILGSVVVGVIWISQRKIGIQ